MNILRPITKRIKKTIYQRTKILGNRYPQYEIGRHTYGDPKISSWKDGTQLTIGAFCSIAKGVHIFLGGEHRVEWVTTYPFTHLWESGRKFSGHPKSRGDVIIGNDVWIGAKVMIMSGVTIGDGAVVGANSVVTKGIEPYAICAGNPAQLIRKRFDDKIIQELLEIRWWDFKDPEIEKLLPFMLSDDIDAFIREARKIKEKK